MAKTESVIKRYGEWLFRTVLLGAMMLNLWLTQSFVTRKEFDQQTRENTSAHLAIQTSVADIAATMKMLANNITKLDDHENRLRYVEARQTDVIARLSIQERRTEKLETK